MVEEVWSTMLVCQHWIHDKRLTDSFQDWSVKFHRTIEVGLDGTQIDSIILGLVNLHMMLVVLSVSTRRPAILCVQVNNKPKLVLEVIR